MLNYQTYIATKSQRTLQKYTKKPKESTKKQINKRKKMVWKKTIPNIQQTKK